MSNSPTSLTLAHMRKQGYRADVVEKTVPKTFIKKDLFGIIDVLCVGKGDTIGIQCTSDNGGNVAKRVRKMQEAEAIGDLREAGWELWVVGWRKKKGRWVCRVVDMS